MSKVLVVCYSRTGTTRKLADAMVELTGWDLDPIVDTRDRSGILGFLRAGFEARARRSTRLVPARLEPAAYDLVVVGSPVWGKRVSVPVRAYLDAHARELRRVAFFLTCGGSGSDEVLEQMQQLAGQPPAATLVVTERQLARREHLGAVTRFVDALRALRSGDAADPTSSTVGASAPSAH